MLKRIAMSLAFTLLAAGPALTGKWGPLENGDGARFSVKG